MKKILLMIVVMFAFSTFAFAGLNINSATQSELEQLQGIGPAKARAIIEYREQNGSFKSKDELEKVNGIGSETIKRLGDSITVGENARAKEKSRILVMIDREFCQHRGQC